MSTTLIQELKEAAQVVEGAGRKTGTLAAIAEAGLMAARLRARIHHVIGMADEADALAEELNDVRVLKLINRLKGPLP